MNRMQVRDIMTQDVKVVSPEDTIEFTSEKMRKHNIGALPVFDGSRILGFITDRDLAVKAIAKRLDFKTPIREIMSRDVVFIFDTDPVSRAAELMQENKVRRLVVLNTNKELIGILSLGDLVMENEHHPLVGRTLKKISESYLFPLPGRMLTRNKRTAILAGTPLGALALAGGVYFWNKRRRAA